MKSDGAPSDEGRSPAQPAAGSRTRQLEIQHHVSGGRHTIRLTGELDMAVSGQVEQLVRELARGPVAVVMDLDRLDFIDSAGLRGIVVCGQECQRAGGSLVVTLANPRIRRVFEIAGLLENAPFTCMLAADGGGESREGAS
jgi:anti-sigma B factor antagonist